MTEPTWQHNSRQAECLPALGRLCEFYPYYSTEPHIGQLVLHEGHGEPAWFILNPAQLEFEHSRHKHCVRIWRYLEAPAEHADFVVRQAVARQEMLRSMSAAWDKELNSAIPRSPSQTAS